jgi:hypothetical protein
VTGWETRTGIGPFPFFSLLFNGTPPARRMARSQQ